MDPSWIGNAKGPYTAHCSPERKAQTTSSLMLVKPIKHCCCDRSGRHQKRRMILLRLSTTRKCDSERFRITDDVLFYLGSVTHGTNTEDGKVIWAVKDSKSKTPAPFTGAQQGMIWWCYVPFVSTYFRQANITIEHVAFRHPSQTRVLVWELGKQRYSKYGFDVVEDNMWFDLILCMRW